MGQASLGRPRERARARAQPGGAVMNGVLAAGLARTSISSPSGGAAAAVGVGSVRAGGGSAPPVPPPPAPATSGIYIEGARA